jgi:hypothetical protein
MPLTKTGKLEVSTTVKLILFAAVFALAVALSWHYITQGGGQVGKGLESVGTPGKPDITVSVTCISAKDTGGLTKDIATHSTLQYTIRNSGEAPVKSEFKVTVNRKDGSVLATTKIASLQKGTSQTLKYPAQGSAARGTYIVDADTEDRIDETSDVNNSDQDDCDGNTLVGCFTKLPAEVLLTYYCPTECTSQTVTARQSCNGCKNPRQIGPDDSCADSCGCVCPAKTLAYTKTASHQIQSGETCGGRLLPDLTLQIGTLTSNGVTVSVKNIGTALAAKSTLCIKTVSSGGKEQTSEKSVNGLSAGSDVDTFAVQGVKAGTTVTAEADCKKVVEERDENNNINTKQF